MLNDIRFVIFDMDGLLFDTERQSFLALNQAAEKAGFEFSLETYKKLMGADDKTTNHILTDIYGNQFLKAGILKTYQEGFQKILKKEGVQIKKGALDLLNVLEEKGIKKCIASSSSRAAIKKYLSITGLTDRFDFYLSGEEVKNGKPNPDIFLEACSRANAAPKYTLVLEDSFHGFKAAIAAGIQCILIPDLMEPNDEMKNHAYRICKDLGEVANIILNS